MITLTPPMRIATEADAAALAVLMNIAGDGLPLHVWTQLAGEGGDPWEIGRARQAAKAAGGGIVVVDPGEGPVAMLTGYAIGAEPVPIAEDVPAVFRPLLKLENRALGSWYVNALACLPEHRGRGIGSELLDLAADMARAEGLERMSVIVAGDNDGARQLYERHGFRVVAEEPCVTEGWDTRTERWLLLTRTLA